MVTTVTNNSPQAINTSLFSLQKEIDDLRRQINQINSKNTAELAKGLVSDDTPDMSVDEIKKLIPDTATPENQLADKDFVNSSIPTKTSQLTNDSGFITSSGSITGNAATATTADTATKAIQDGNGNVITSTYAKKGEVGVPQVVHFNTSNLAGSYKLVRFSFRSAFRCVISGTCGNYAEAKIIDVIASAADAPQSNTLGNIVIGASQGNFSFGGGDWSYSFMYWNKPLTEENVYYTVVLIPYSENNIELVI